MCCELLRVLAVLMIVLLVVICASQAVESQQAFLVTGNRRTSDKHLCSIMFLLLLQSV